MNHKTLLACAATALLVGLGAGQAQATTYDLTLSGDPTTFSHGAPFVFQDKLFSQYSLGLTGLDSSNAISVTNGDEIVSTISLTSSYTIPASVSRTDLVYDLTSATFPAENTGVGGTYTFSLGGSVVASYSFGSTSSSALSAFTPLFPPNNGSLTFDSLVVDETIGTLATPATIDSAGFTYSLVTDVPEPSAWMLMLAGVAGIGGALRLGRKRAAGVVA